VRVESMSRSTHCGFLRKPWSVAFESGSDDAALDCVFLNGMSM